VVRLAGIEEAEGVADGRAWLAEALFEDVPTPELRTLREVERDHFVGVFQDYVGPTGEVGRGVSRDRRVDPGRARLQRVAEDDVIAALPTLLHR
jgi:hypothetical protein